MKRKRIEPGIYRVGKKYEADVHLTNPRTLKRERIRKRFTALSDARRFRKQKQREFSKGEPSKSKRTFRIRMKDAVALSLQAKLQTARRRSGEIDAEPATFGEMQRHLGIVGVFWQRLSCQSNR
jgi:cbb3-type cytochrome oxidase cytochrome c subunit